MGARGLRLRVVAFLGECFGNSGLCRGCNLEETSVQFHKRCREDDITFRLLCDRVTRLVVAGIPHERRCLLREGVWGLRTLLVGGVSESRRETSS